MSTHCVHKGNLPYKSNCFSFEDAIKVVDIQLKRSFKAKLIHILITLMVWSFSIRN